MLERILALLPQAPDPEGRILHGVGNNEDAVIVRMPPQGMALVQTVDVLTPLGNDPRRFGQTAAANALSDVYAMGGEPWSVMNIVAFPASELPLTIVAEILAGGLEKVAEAGAVLAGGHTLEDKEIKFGLAVTGMVRPDAIAANDKVRAGDALILTKPLGTGVLATALKAGWPDGERAADVENELYRWTTRLNRNAAHVVRSMRLAAATDITGFGLGGHLLEMARGSGVAAELDVSALPFMEGVLDFAAEGLIPAGTYANKNHCACMTHLAADVDELRALLAFDAQTSGGLLLAVPAPRVAEAVERLTELGEPAYIVGRAVAPGPDGPRLILA